MTQVTINNETTTFASVKSALMYTRDIIRNARRIYRKAHCLPDNVHELPPAERTGYDLVDMAPYKLSNMGAEQLCKLLNDYGISAKIETND